MRLASLKHGRDGRLVVVSSDFERMLSAQDVAPTLQSALDDWDAVEPQLRALSARLEKGEGEPFDEAACASPLPRAYQWADASAYVNHVALVRQARGAEMPASFWTDPLMYQGGSDGFLDPRAPITFPADAADWGVDFEAEVAVITGDVPLGAGEEEAQRAIRLVTLVNDVSLRGLIPGEIGKGFGFFQSKPASAFAPVAVTPDALGVLWDGARLSGTLSVDLNGTPFGRASTGQDMTFSFPRLIAHAARTRALGAGTIVGSGTVSNLEDGAPARTIAAGGPGYSCIAEVRMIETINGGSPKTPFLQNGDSLRIQMRHEGRTMFGAIDQTVAIGSAARRNAA